MCSLLAGGCTCRCMSSTWTPRRGMARNPRSPASGCTPCAKNTKQFECFWAIAFATRSFTNCQRLVPSYLPIRPGAKSCARARARFSRCFSAGAQGGFGGEGDKVGGHAKPGPTLPRLLSPAGPGVSHALDQKRERSPFSNYHDQVLIRGDALYNRGNVWLAVCEHSFF